MTQRGQPVHPPSVETSQARRRSLALDAAALLLCLLPLCVTAHLPLLDLPNHMARQVILRDLAGDPALQAVYSVQWALTPNLALEGFVGIAGLVLPIDAAMRAFCIATITALFFGTRLIHRHRTAGTGGLHRIVPLLCYGGPFQYGFLSFCFGIGLALLSFGVFLRLREKPWIVQALILAPLGFLLLLCHLAAFALLAAAICAEVLVAALPQPAGGRWLPLRGAALTSSVTRIARAALATGSWLLPPLLLFLAFSPTFGAGHGVRLSNLREKAESLAAITLFSLPAVELPLLGAAIAGLGVALATKRLRLPASGAVILAVQSLLWLALPRSAIAGGFIDYRIPWAISFFLLANLVPARHAPATLLDTALRQGFAALAVLRIAAITALWLAWEPTLAAIDQALARLPHGARLMVVQGHLPSASADRRPSLDHVAAYAVARAHAYEPGIFADISGQILHLRPPFTHPWAAAPQQMDALPGWADHLLVLRPEQAKLGRDLRLRCLAQGHRFILYRADPDHHPIGDDPRAGCP